MYIRMTRHFPLPEIGWLSSSSLVFIQGTLITNRASLVCSPARSLWGMLYNIYSFLTGLLPMWCSSVPNLKIFNSLTPHAILGISTLFIYVAAFSEAFLSTSSTLVCCIHPGPDEGLIQSRNLVCPTLHVISIWNAKTLLTEDHLMVIQSKNTFHPSLKLVDIYHT